MAEQLSLGLRLRPDAQFKNYFVSDLNQHTCLYLQQLSCHEARESMVFLAGASTLGKTHLLQASCHQADRLGRRTFYLPLKEAKQNWSHEILENLQEIDFLAIDDVDAIVGNRLWEEYLFYLIHRLLLTQKTDVLISGIAWPQRLNCLMPELSSRLATCLVLELQTLNHEELAMAFEHQCHARGMKIGTHAAAYLARLYDYQPEPLFASMEEWDGLCLTARRALTIPFIKSIKTEN